MSDTFTALVSGAGPAGLAAAILLKQEGINVALIAPPTPADVRTTALMQPAIQLLSDIGLWPGEIAQHCAPLQRLHLVDDTGHLVQAPRIEFASTELGLSEFGFNVPLAHLIPALRARAEQLGVVMINDKSASATATADAVIVTTESGARFNAKALLIADGAQSPLRKSLGFSTQGASFEQQALAFSFDHSAPHEFTSTEWHKKDGPFTTVPLPGLRSSLVWMSNPARISALMAMGDKELATQVQLESHGTLGRISNPGPRRTFAMQTQQSSPLAKSRAYLIGEAGHALPPIGAQGLNLSLRDAATVADMIVGADDPGAPQLCAEYARLRSLDVAPRIAITRLLNNTLLSDLAAPHLARVVGLAAVAKFPPLRQMALHQGLSTASPLPFAMRRAH
jgi:2-octaprenyl-6-methoxyphenol hydroxylase